MVFSIFSKPPPAPVPKGQVGSRPAAPKPQPNRSAKGLGLLDIQAKAGGPLNRFTATRYGTASKRARAAAKDKRKPSIELGPTDFGFSPALENAALLYAGGQAAVARQVLGSALTNEPDSRALALAWHAQFDLLQRANDRAAFDQLAIEYVSVFERSPPPWDEARTPSAKPGAPGAPGAKGDPGAAVSAPVEPIVKAAMFPGGASSDANTKRFRGSTVRYRVPPPRKGDPRMGVNAPVASACSASILPASAT